MPRQTSVKSTRKKSEPIIQEETLASTQESDTFVKKIMQDDEIDAEFIFTYNGQILETMSMCQREITYEILKFKYKKNIQKDNGFINDVFDYSEFLSKKIKQKCEILPLITSKNILNKCNEIIDFIPLNNDVYQLVKQLKKIDFQLSIILVKIIYFKMTQTKNNSIFLKNIQNIFIEEHTNWNSIDPNISFFLLSQLILCHPNFNIYISEETLSFSDIIFHKKINVTSSGICNLYQQMIHNNKIVSCSEIPFIREKTKSTYDLDVYLVYGEMEGGYLLEKDCFPLFFHDSTLRFFSDERKPNIIYNHIYTYLLTFNYFLKSKILPGDRFRYLLAGSVIKAALNVRDCNDVDFFVLDHENNIEKYGTFAPNVGIKGIFDDFGKTYYANEKYYFPMINERYEMQQQFKKFMKEHPELREDNDPLTIFNNFPKYSASGLKAGRYIDIYSAECKKIGYNINNLDDLVMDPENRIYFLGCPVIKLKLEMVRDNIKDIDLGRCSIKQLHDFHFLYKNYINLFNHDDIQEFCFNKFDEKKSHINDNKISLKINCYNKEPEKISVDGVERPPDGSFDLIIRRQPLYFIEMIKKLIDEGPLLKLRGNIIWHKDGMIYQNPLLSSLPQQMEVLGKGPKDVMYYYELSHNGEIKINIYCGNKVDERVCLFDTICVCGYIKVEVIDNKKIIYISVEGSKMNDILSQILTVEHRKKYRTRLIELMKNILQMHKMVDCHIPDGILLTYGGNLIKF